MPTYGHNKTRTMVRSVLPSTARKQIKKRKDNLHRNNRRVVNTHLHNLRGYASDVAEYFDDDEFNYNHYIEPHRSNDDWEDIVYARRNADKLNHFEVWAYEKTKHLDPDMRFKKIASMLGGVLGTHALSHLAFLKPDPLGRDTWHDELPTRYRRRSYRQQYTSQRKLLRIQVNEAIFAMYRDDKKRNDFNAFLLANSGRDVQIVIRYNYTTIDPAFQYSKFYTRYEDKVVHIGNRTLNGYHDVHKFVRDIFDASTPKSDLGYHPSWLKAVCQYFEIDTTLVLGQR